MKIVDLVKQAKQTNPQLKGLPAPKAVALVRSVFTQLKQELNSKEKGPMQIPGLGVFQINLVEKEEAGKKITKRRINFRVGQPQVKKNAPNT